MILGEHVAGALRSIFHHKVRACLTMLGMVFGVGAVIAMIAISEGARAEVMSSISDLGADAILARSVKPPPSQRPADASESKLRFGLTYADRDHILASMPAGTACLTIRASTKKIPWGIKSESVPIKILATEPGYRRAAHPSVMRGRFLDELDQERRDPVVAVGCDLVKDGFPLQDPCGATMTIGGAVFRVIGVVKAAGSSGPGGASADELDHSIFMPLSTNRDYIGVVDLDITDNGYAISREDISHLVLHCPPDVDPIATGKLLRRVLAHSHPRNDVEVVIPLELLEQKRRTQRTFTIIMSSIASISLLVGGIGITNIMLASVLERTREIGIRRAVGARRRDILNQFLLETVLMSLIGGAVGIVIGILVAYLVNHFSGWPILVTWWSVALSIGIAALVGLLSGVSPAVTAARMQPVEALRHA